MPTGRGGPPRILHVHAALVRGGAETWMMDVLRSSAGGEWQIDVCLTDPARFGGEYEAEFERLGGRILRCPLGRNPWVFERRFERLLRGEQYDVVHSHFYYFSGFLLRAAARAGIPARIAHIHPVIDLKSRQPMRRIFVWWMKGLLRRYATGFVAPSEASMAGIWGPAWATDPRNRIVYNGIHIERFAQPGDRAGLRRELRIPLNAPIVLNVSRFVPHKRQELLVEVATRVLGQNPDVHFVLIGAGETRTAVQEQVKARGLESNFRFIAGLPSIDPYWLAADVFAFPSCNEGFGIVVIEAVAAGLRVIAQDIPGVQEAAAPFPEVRLLPVETPPDAWAQVLREVLAQPRVTEERRQELLRDFPFTIERSIAALKAVYRGHAR